MHHKNKLVYTASLMPVQGNVVLIVVMFYRLVDDQILWVLYNRSLIMLLWVLYNRSLIVVTG